MAKASKNTEAATGSDNGGIIFQKMPKGYEIPKRQTSGVWDALIAQLCASENKGSVVKVYEAPKDDEQLVYTRSKALRQAAKRAGKDVTVAVRIEGTGDDAKSVLLAQGN